MTLPRSTPEEQGVAPHALLDTLDALVANAELHSVMVLRHGHVVAEGWSHPYAPERPHTLFSLSKSFTATAVGLAVDEGRFGLDDLVVDLLPDAAPPVVDDRLARLTVRHLLTMTSGHDPDPSGAVFDPPGDWVEHFLAEPLVAEPGTRFVYNTAATYVLSAIVQRLTGQRLLDYLRPRLFEPLGIAEPTWEQSPQGIDTGGFGLSVRTEDIAAFGQLLLQDGVWQGRRLLPAGWVALASAAQVCNGDAATGNDWSQGYGFQFWRSRHGYRGDGAFGQFCVVLPEQDVVVAITSAVDEMQVSLDAVWQLLLPGLHPQPLPADPDGRAALSERLSGLRLDPPIGAAVTDIARRVSGHRIEFDENPLRLTSAVLVTGPEADSVVAQLGDRTLELRAGHESPVAQTVRHWTDARQSPAALVSGVWTEPDRYVLTVRWVETPTVATVVLSLDGDAVTVEPSVNISFGPRTVPPIRGRVQGTN